MAHLLLNRVEGDNINETHVPERKVNLKFSLRNPADNSRVTGRVGEKNSGKSTQLPIWQAFPDMNWHLLTDLKDKVIYSCLTDERA